MTVYETLRFQAKLRLLANSSVKKEEFLHRVNNLIADLSLEKVRDTYVGNQAVRGLSTGERKRLQIALELISTPLFVFLDEPTTGLDSYQSQNVVEILKHLTYSGKVVVFSIHQPRLL